MEPARTEGSGTGLTREIVVIGGVVVLGAIMSILDATIVNVAIPTLGRDFRTSISTIQWVLTGYLLAFASVIPLTGWATSRFGAKRVWVASLVLFMAGSILAGSAWSIGSLVGFRVLQGLGGGLIMPVGQTILAQAAGPQRMGRVMSIVGVPMLLGPVFGPALGGAIVGHASWRWIFFVNLPVGAAAVAAAVRLLPDAGPKARPRLDALGLALLSPGLAVFVYAMSEAGNRGGFWNGTTLGGGAVGLALVGLFVAHSRRRGGDALIDVSLFRSRGFATAAGSTLLLGIALFGSLILLPLYYQLVRGESPLATGLLLVPQGLGAAVAMPLAGWLTDRVGARLVIPAGIAVALVGTAGYTQVAADTSYAFLAAALFVIGVGLGGTVMPAMAVAYQTVSREVVGQATSALNVVQRIAASIGTAFLAVVLQREIATRVPGVDGIRALGALSARQRADTSAALAGAFGATFWVALALLATALVPALLLPRRRRDVTTAPMDAEAAPRAPTRSEGPRRATAA